MLTRMLLPVAGLIAGTGLGYWLGSHPQTRASTDNATVAAAPATASSTTTVKASSEAAAKRKEEEEKSEAKARSLSDGVSALLEDFSEKRAAKWCETLSADDLQSCLRQLAGMKPKTEVHELRAELMRAWAKTDPEGAWKAALATTELNWRTSMLGAVAGEVAKTSPERAIQLALSLGMGSDRSAVLSAVFNGWAKVNPGAAVAYGNSHPDLPMGDYGLNGAIGAVAEKDPRQAAQLALTLASPNARQNAFYTVFNEWFDKDPDGVRQWVQGITDPAMRDEAIGAFVSSEAARSPQQALELAQQIGSVDSRRIAVQNAISSWMRRDPAGAMDYVLAQASTNPDEDLGWSFGYAMSALTAKEQSDLLTKLPDGQMKTRTITNLASNQMYRGQYSQAVAALNMLPDSNERDYALTNLGQGWGKNNGQTLTQWLNQQPDSSDRDLVVAGYVSSLANTNPQSAVQWATRSRIKRSKRPPTRTSPRAGS